MSNFFPLRVDPILKGLHCPGKQTESHKVVSLCKNDIKSCRCTLKQIHFKCMLLLECRRSYEVYNRDKLLNDHGIQIFEFANKNFARKSISRCLSTI